jgi:cytoskeletal protein CcmA (bactofilin family)
MFKPSDDQPGKEIETIIGPTVQVEGNFNSRGNIMIEGAFKGTLKTAKNIKVGERAVIQANISAENALIAGEIKGNLKIKGILEVKKTAKIIGDIETKIITVESGALINGKFTMLKDEPEASKTLPAENNKKK